MPGCLEGLHAIASRILEGVAHDAVTQELEGLASKTLRHPESCIFYSSTNPAPIITMKGGKFSAVAAMAIEKGKILKTGSLSDVQAAAPTIKAQTDLKDHCIVPGFVEPHIHVITSALLEKFLVNCDPLAPDTGGTFEGTMALLQKKVPSQAKGSWLLGYGYDPSRLEPRSTPDGLKFPDLTTDIFDDYQLNKNPILIINASGHIAYANTLAMDLAQVDHKNRNDGVLIEPETFQPVISKALPSQIFKVGEIVTGLSVIVSKWSCMGFTTVFDAGIGLTAGFADVLILSVLAAVAPLRIAGAAANLTNEKNASNVVGSSTMPAGGATSLKIRTIKLWMDGSTQGFTGALEGKYLPDMLPTYFQGDPYGWSRWGVHNTCHVKQESTDDIGEAMQVWASRGYQLMVHTNGDCAAEVVLDAFEKLQTPDPNLRHRLEHFTVTRPDQIKRVAKLNLHVSHTIGHVRYWGHTFDKYILGSDRAKRIDPLRDDIDNNVVFSLHSDSPVSQADGLSYVRTAATRLLYNSSPDKPEDVLGPDQTVTVEQALAGITINPASQILLDDEIGTLEEGKDADFVILKHDITAESLPAKDINNAWVSETWYKGSKVYSKTS